MLYIVFESNYYSFVLSLSSLPNNISELPINIEIKQSTAVVT